MVSAIATSGCGEPLETGATATVVGRQVIVTVGAAQDHGAEGGTTRFTVNGVTREQTDPEAIFVFDGDAIGPGAHTWRVETARGERTGAAEVAFRVPASGGDAPPFRVIGCRFQSRGGHTIGFGGELATDGAKLCDFDDGYVRISYVAPPGAVVRIGDQTLSGEPAGEHAPLSARIGLLDVLGSTPLEALLRGEGGPAGQPASPSGDVFEAKVRVAPESGPAVDGVLAIEMTYPDTLRTTLRRLLSAVAATKGLPCARTGKPPSKEASVAVVDTTFSGLWVAGDDVAIRDVGYVALITHQPGRPAGECGPYRRPGDEVELMATQILVDYEVVIHRAGDGVEVARSRIAAVEGPCPEVVPAERDDKGLVTYDYPEREEVDAWLVAQRASWASGAAHE